MRWALVIGRGLFHLQIFHWIYQCYPQALQRNQSKSNDRYKYSGYKINAQGLNDPVNILPQPLVTEIISQRPGNQIRNQSAYKN
jgi:hypothetical protein